MYHGKDNCLQLTPTHHRCTPRIHSWAPSARNVHHLSGGNVHHLSFLEKHGFCHHCHDTQMYRSFQPARISTCLTDLSIWRKDHHLQLNLSEKDCRLTPAKESICHKINLKMGSSTVYPNKDVKNFGIMINHHLSFITNYIASGLPFCAVNHTEMVIVISRLDDCIWFQNRNEMNTCFQSASAIYYKVSITVCCYIVSNSLISYLIVWPGNGIPPANILLISSRNSYPSSCVYLHTSCYLLHHFLHYLLGYLLRSKYLQKSHNSIINNPKRQKSSPDWRASPGSMFVCENVDNLLNKLGGSDMVTVFGCSD